MFFFNDTATTEIYTLSLHDALPISGTTIEVINTDAEGRLVLADCLAHAIDHGAKRLIDVATLTGGIVTTFGTGHARSEEHTTELQSRQYLVCRLLLEKT